MGGASALGYEQTILTYLAVTGLTLRAIFPSLGSLGNINVGILALLANIVVLVAVSLTTHTSTYTDKVGTSPDPTPKASRRGRSCHGQTALRYRAKGARQECE